MKIHTLFTKTLFLSFIALSFLLAHQSAADAFSISDLSSTAESAKSATEGATLLNRAKNVYSSFSDSTKSLISAQTATMDLINPTKNAGYVKQLGSYNSATGLDKLMQMTSFSQSMKSEMNGMNLTNKLSQILTDSTSLDKAKSIYTDATNSYTTGNKSVAEAKTLYSEIKKFVAAPSSKSLGGSLLSNLSDYSDDILPFILENGPEQIKTAAKLAEAFKGFI
ncbi:hypothetical protein [Desulfovibrio gilichinskyi]|uniref:DUF4197 domain-containing protein n=1 Tax=Desulfovibrio gilichinskyi TaxID=1519643 RepID=A0A1X7CSW0_9BACT|nr:hypothetical protein [Desulfovibrio gilichinskyi]SMF02235.1 hypothetical protein SAMN06295933_1190 [Desulfovibrio gilichinskyi]